MECDACTACGAQTIPGVYACINCGQPRLSDQITVNRKLADVPEEELEAVKLSYPGRHITPAQYRRWVEGRAIEYAGDTAAAIQIYEELVAAQCLILEAHKRLAVLYRKAKQPRDEERVIRAALALVGGSRTSWFVLRLAKILSQQRP